MTAKTHSRLHFPPRFGNRIYSRLPQPVQAIVLIILNPSYRWLRKVTNNRVASGPFRGMRYVHESVWSAFYPKLLGTYEKELWPILEYIITCYPRTVINIGTGEGYYAVGLARRLPLARIVCFEQPWRRYHGLLRRLAKLNNVTNRLEVHGRCTVDLLAANFGSARPTFVLCDVEGAEDELLDPAIIPALRCAYILVEVHDGDVPGVSTRLRERFALTHQIAEISGRSRQPSDWPLNSKSRWEDQEDYLWEHRSEQANWLWMAPNDNQQDAQSD